MKKTIVLFMVILSFLMTSIAFAEPEIIGTVNTEHGEMIVKCEIPDGYTWEYVVNPELLRYKVDPDGEVLIQLTPSDPLKPVIFVDAYPIYRYRDIPTLNKMCYEDFVEYREEYYCYEGALFSECVRNDGIIYLKSIDEEYTNAAVGTIINGCDVSVSLDTTDTCEKLSDYDIVMAEEIMDSIVLSKFFPTGQSTENNKIRLASDEE